MAIGRKLVVGTAVAAVIAGVGAAPALAATDANHDVRLQSALAYPGVINAINHVNAVGDFIDYLNARSPAPDTNYAGFGRIGTVANVIVVPKATGDKKVVAVVVNRIEQSFNGNGQVTVLFDDDSNQFGGWAKGIALRDNGDPRHLAKIDETNIKVGDKIGVLGSLWRGIGMAAVVVVKTV